MNPVSVWRPQTGRLLFIQPAQQHFLNFLAGTTMNIGVIQERYHNVAIARTGLKVAGNCADVIKRSGFLVRLPGQLTIAKPPRQGAVQSRQRE